MKSHKNDSVQDLIKKLENQQGDLEERKKAYDQLKDMAKNPDKYKSTYPLLKEYFLEIISAKLLAYDKERSEFLINFATQDNSLSERGMAPPSESAVLRSSEKRAEIISQDPELKAALADCAALIQADEEQKKKRKAIDSTSIGKNKPRANPNPQIKEKSEALAQVNREIDSSISTIKSLQAELESIVSSSKKSALSQQVDNAMDMGRLHISRLKSKIAAREGMLEEYKHIIDEEQQVASIFAEHQSIYDRIHKTCEKNITIIHKSLRQLARDEANNDGHRSEFDKKNIEKNSAHFNICLEKLLEFKQNYQTQHMKDLAVLKDSAVSVESAKAALTRIKEYEKQMQAFEKEVAIAECLEKNRQIALADKQLSLNRDKKLYRDRILVIYSDIAKFMSDHGINHANFPQPDGDFMTVLEPFSRSSIVEKTSEAISRLDLEKGIYSTADLDNLMVRMNQTLEEELKKNKKSGQKK